MLTDSQAAAARRTLSTLPRGTAYDDSLAFLALVSDITYTREILRQECVPLVYLPTLWDARAELDRKRVATQSGICRLQQEVAERVRTGVAALRQSKTASASQQETGGAVSASTPSVTDDLAEAVGGVRKVALPAVEQDVKRIVATVQDAQSTAVKLIGHDEAGLFVRSASGETTTAEVQLLRPLNEQVDQLQSVLHWLQKAEPGWLQSVSHGLFSRKG